MTQFNLDTPINPATKSGSTLAADLSGSSKWRDALHSLHKGSSTPSYIQAGMLWVDDSNDPVWSLYLYDGADNILISNINTTTNSAAEYLPDRIIMSNGTDGDHDIDTTAGSFIFNDPGGLPVVRSGWAKVAGSFTKQIDATWVQGTGNGGRPSATVSLVPNAWYHYHALSSADGSVVDFGFDGSPYAVELFTDTNVIAAGLTKYKRLGSVRTDASSNILGFTQTGNDFEFDVPVSDVDTSDPGAAALTRTIMTPLGVQTRANINVTLRKITGVATFGVVYSPNISDPTPNAEIHNLYVDPSNSEISIYAGHVITNIASQVKTVFSSSDLQTTLIISTMGWQEIE